MPGSIKWKSRFTATRLSIDANPTNFQMVSAEHDVKSQEVLELARSSGCSAYDCEYAALAMQLDVKLVTMDGKLLKAFPKHTLSLSDTRAEHWR